MVASILLLLLRFALSGHYKGFNVSVYMPAHEVAKVGNRTWLESTWKIITDQVQVDKVYVETHRDGQEVSSELIKEAKKFFNDRGVETAGGITFTWGGSERSEAGQDMFSTFCFSNETHRAKAKALVEKTAQIHDSFILDDFFFTACKSNVEIAAKGRKTWSDYRRDIMAEAGKVLVVDPAHKANENCRAIIKYPNWYEHFAGLGFDLTRGPKIFDGIWTGTETRNPDGTQHLQNYLSYGVIRYFNNAAPGKNGGGWVDTFDIDRPTLGGDRYAEQLWLTLFAKPKEIILFAYNGMLDSKLNRALHRTIWQGQGSSFNYDTCTADFTNAKGEKVHPTTFARIAGCTFEAVQNFVGKLGNPYGIKTYKPPNARGDDYVEDFLGMIGIPIEAVPDYPVDANTVIVTAAAASDPNISAKLNKTIAEGGNVFVTSGLVVAAPAKVSEIVEVSAKKNIIINNFSGNLSTKDILVKQIWYQTNDAWEIVSAGRVLVNGFFGVPIVLRGTYGERGGSLYVLTIPEDPGDLYLYPEAVLNTIRGIVTKKLNVTFQGPAKVSIFLYDNDYFIIENFNDVAVQTNVFFGNRAVLVTEEGVTGPGNVVSARASFPVRLAPHQYRVFSAK